MKRINVGPSTMYVLKKELKAKQKAVHIAFGVLIALILCIFLFLDKISKPTGNMCASVLIDLNDGSGSGVYIGNNLILSAAHVVDGMIVDEDRCRVEFQDPNATDGRHIIAEAIVKVAGNYKSNPCEDYALLEITSLNADNVASSYSVGHSKKVKVSDAINVEGYPGGYYSNTDGTINSINGANNSDIFVVNAASWPGNSGGALLDKNKNVIGLVIQKGYGIVNDGQTYALKIDRVRQELNVKGFHI